MQEQAAGGSAPGTAFAVIARAIAACESSAEVYRLSSRHVACVAGTGTPGAQEKAGPDLFENKSQCAACHSPGAGPNAEPILFTDFTFDNPGDPLKAANPSACPTRRRAGSRRSYVWFLHGLCMKNTQRFRCLFNSMSDNPAHLPVHQRGGRKPACTELSMHSRLVQHLTGINLYGDGGVISRPLRRVSPGSSGFP